MKENGAEVERAESGKPTGSAYPDRVNDPASGEGVIVPADSFTIVAPATPPVAGGVGILRLSGPSALPIALEVAPDVPAAPVARHGYFAKFVAAGDSACEQGVFIYF